MITNFRHTGIVVRNLENCLRFYEELGFFLVKREIESGQYLDQVVGLRQAKIETAKLKAPCGSMIELLQYLSHPKNKSIKMRESYQLGCSHIALTVTSLDEALNLVKQLGGSLVNPPSIPPNGQVKVAYCHDLEGNILELVEVL